MLVGVFRKSTDFDKKKSKMSVLVFVCSDALFPGFLKFLRIGKLPESQPDSLVQGLGQSLLSITLDSS